MNFIDVYFRTGMYPMPSLPAIPGIEGSGIVESIGEGVTEFKPGDRVAYAGIPPGAYSQVRLIPAHRLIMLPDFIDFKTAAGIMLRGMTARYLLKMCCQIKSTDTILIHAAAGGVGTILCQWANHIGAKIIGTVGSAKKAAEAKANGCHHTILYRSSDFLDEVNKITGGLGVDVVYDSVGQATFLKSLDCLKNFGTMVSFGQASGSVAPFDIGLLAAKGSLFLTRPTIKTYTESREDLLDHAKDLFEMIARNIVKPCINEEYARKMPSLLMKTWRPGKHRAVQF
jgi:NADPH2:quinone reductase